MSTDDRAIRVELRSKDRLHVLSTIRQNGAGVFLSLEEWGLVEDAGATLADFVSQLEQAESIWALAAEDWITPKILSLLVQVLSESWEAALIESAREGDTTALRPSAGLPVSLQEARQIVSELRTAQARASKAPLPELKYLERPHVAEELEELAGLYSVLARQIAAFSMPQRGPGRPKPARTILAEELAILLGLYLEDTPRRRWTSEIVTEFLGVRTSIDYLRRTESARTAARKRPRGKPGGSREP